MSKDDVVGKRLGIYGCFALVGYLLQAIYFSPIVILLICLLGLFLYEQFLNHPQKTQSFDNSASVNEILNDIPLMIAKIDLRNATLLALNQRLTAIINPGFTHQLEGKSLFSLFSKNDEKN